MGLSFRIAADPRQRSHSQVRVPRDTWQYFTVWRFESSPNLEEPGSRIYIPQGTGWPSYTPRHWVPFSSPATVEVCLPFTAHRVFDTTWSPLQNVASNSSCIAPRVLTSVFTELLPMNLLRGGGVVVIYTSMSSHSSPFSFQNKESRLKINKTYLQISIQRHMEPG
jgi:hypothetical protein